MSNNNNNNNKTDENVDPLRSLFPDKTAVKIYPDDYIIDPKKGIVNKDLAIADLIDRHSGHFSDKRVAILFRPGTYEDIDLPVGYWTQVLGLGETPNDVVFKGDTKSGVYCLPANMENPGVGSLDTFWRSAENFTSDCPLPTVSTADGENDEEWFLESKSSESGNSNRGMLWAVSQAAPLRRIRVANNLHLSLGENYASGGFIANVNVGGYLMFGTQQQFSVRNCDIGQKATGGAWSMVFNGCQGDCVDGAKDGQVDWDGTSPMTVCEPTTARQVEKPFIFLNKADDDDNESTDPAVYLAIPKMKADSTGVDFDKLSDDEKVKIDNADNVRVVDKWTPFQEVQAAADNGTHLILSPGIYNWGETLYITQSNQVVLGLGMATLQAPGDGKPCIHVSHEAQGVRLSGLSLEASVISKFIYEGSTLLQWGDADTMGASGGNDATNPGVMHDIYCFVGGRHLERTVKVECMVKIYSDHVIGDNLWLWRADHVQIMPGEAPNKPELSEYHVTTDGECECDTGLEVRGDNVVFVGLAVEHTYKDMLSWYGRDGEVYFYQSELPYDAIGSSYKDIAGYRVHASATGHVSKGVGVYSYFRDCPGVEVESAIVDHAANSNFINCFTVWLNGHSGIKSVINGRGGVTAMPGKTVEVASYRSDIFFSSYFWLGLFRGKTVQEILRRGWTFLYRELLKGIQRSSHALTNASKDSTM